MKTLHLLIIATIISLCAFSTLPSYSGCAGIYEPHIQKDNGTDTEGYHTYQAFAEDNQTYPVKYEISNNATLENIYLQKEFPSLTIIIKEVSQQGNLTIQLPTKLLGLYNGGGFSLAVGAMCANIEYATFPTPIESNSDYTTISFPLMNYDGVREMIIIDGNNVIPQGNQAIPEFPFAIPILTISIISLIVFYRISIKK